MKKLMIALTVLIGFIVSVQAEVSIGSQSYQKVVKKKKAKWVKATKVIPGSVVLYINTISNKGTQKAENLVIVNHIPKHMDYLNGTARCKSKCDVSYSVDGGKTFAKPNKLYVKDKKTKKKRHAKAKEYTSIKWIVSKLKGGKKTSVQYRARLQ